MNTFSSVISNDLKHDMDDWRRENNRNHPFFRDTTSKSLSDLDPMDGQRMPKKTIDIFLESDQIPSYEDMIRLTTAVDQLCVMKDYHRDDEVIDKIESDHMVFGDTTAIREANNIVKKLKLKNH